jgi:hypothetical protein
MNAWTGECFHAGLTYIFDLDPALRCVLCSKSKCPDSSGVPLPSRPTVYNSGSNSSFHLAEIGSLAAASRSHVESRERMNGSWDA